MTGVTKARAVARTAVIASCLDKRRIRPIVSSASRLSEEGNTSNRDYRLRLNHGFILWQLRAQAPLQFLAQLIHFHARHHDELARQHLARLIIIRQLAAYPAILAILIPAEAPVRNGLRAEKLEAPQQ